MNCSKLIEMVVIIMSKGRDKFKKFSPAINFFVRAFTLLPKKSLKKLLSFFQGTKGLKGIVIRYILLKSICEECGDNVSIHPNVYLFNVEKIRFGSNVSVHPMCYFDGDGEITIGNNVSIAHNTTILSSNHKYQDSLTPIKYQGMEYQKTIINNDVWIGAKVTILSGVVINSGCVIAAGAVVSKSFDENSIIAGVPGRIIKSRI